MSISRTGNGTAQACAACKYQRRKCASDCILAPYFPHDRQRQFLNAHKLFGVSNITKIIKNLSPPEKDAAMRTIIFQSDVRANDPVGGCYRMIRELSAQIEYSKAELDLVLHQLAICRSQAHQQSHHFQQAQDTDDTSRIDCEIVNAADPFDVYDPLMQYQCPQSHQEREFVVQDNQAVQLQEDASIGWDVQDLNTVSSPSPPYLHAKQPNYVNVNDCDDIKSFLDVNDVKFEPEDLVHEKRFVPSTQLVISS